MHLNIKQGRWGQRRPKNPEIYIVRDKAGNSGKWRVMTGSLVWGGGGGRGDMIIKQDHIERAPYVAKTNKMKKMSKILKF